MRIVYFTLLLSIAFIFTNVVDAKEFELKIDRFVENRFGEPQIYVTAFNNSKKDVTYISVKCLLKDDDKTVAIDSRLYINLLAGDQDTVRFWFKEENLKYDSVVCKIKEINTN